MIRFASLGRRIRTYKKVRSFAGSHRRATARRHPGVHSGSGRAFRREAGRDVGDFVARSWVPRASPSSKKRPRTARRTISASKVFESQVLPKLAPPETFEISKLSQLENLKIAALFPEGLWFRVSRTIPTVFSQRDLSGKLHFFFLDDLLLTYLGPMFNVKGTAGLVRLTRDADFTADIGDQDPASIPDIIRTSLSGREKGAPVRLQYIGDFAPQFLEHAAIALKLVHGQLLPAPGTLCLHGLWALYDCQAPEMLKADSGLRYPSLEPKLPPEFSDPATMFNTMKKQDFLLHHPYDTFDAFVAWVKAAAEDPDVEMIEQTIYRMDRASPLLDVLKMAASRKRVRVAIELRARFDEFNNLRLADELRKAGVEVFFGLGKLKLHAKVTLITRREGDTKALYTHLSTGNYNAKTRAGLHRHGDFNGASRDRQRRAACFSTACAREKYRSDSSASFPRRRGCTADCYGHIEAETAAAERGRENPHRCESERAPSTKW